MKYIKSFKLFEDNNDYTVGDIVFIRHTHTGEVTPVKIIEINGDFYTVSHRGVANSMIKTNFSGQKDEVIRKYQIISAYIPNTTPIEPSYNRTNNPTIRIPDETGAKGQPFKSNDINMI